MTDMIMEQAVTVRKGKNDEDIKKITLIFSVKRIFTAGICFIVLFFLITNLFNLPFEEKTGLKTKENKITGEITEPVSDNNIVIQSLFFINQ